ncbi:hypothetical protein DSL72_004022 [Monilinia vaccinii-corymbosi]|uniref:Uncharacterized protein n=1 Tax=Monilinia vaccinii-corymbosi TaxID=61207 RepID=A0A8A3P6T9_9HELO|nr:hypothetical protein DSL72_004022 [Monilinia vaccinii-corymbosi]
MQHPSLHVQDKLAKALENECLQCFALKIIVKTWWRSTRLGKLAAPSCRMLMQVKSLREYSHVVLCIEKNIQQIVIRDTRKVILIGLPILTPWGDVQMR